MRWSMLAVGVDGKDFDGAVNVAHVDTLAVLGVEKARITYQSGRVWL